MSQSFGERLRSLRTRRRLTPSSLAHAVGVTEGAIRQMESGQTKSASFVVGLKLANVLGVTPWFLATGDDAPSGTRSPSTDEAVSKTVAEQLAAHERRLKAIEAQLRSGKRRKASE